MTEDLAESVKGLETIIAGNEEYITDLRSEMTPKADAMKHGKIEELGWTVDSHRTDIEGLNEIIVSLE